MTEHAPTMYRRGETTVWAMRVTGDPALNHRVQHWADLHTKTGHIIPVVVPSTGRGLIIHTPDGTRTAATGDYVIHDPDGHFYPCKPEIFHKTYEEVS